MYLECGGATKALVLDANDRAHHTPLRTACMRTRVCVSALRAHAYSRVGGVSLCTLARLLDCSCATERLSTCLLCSVSPQATPLVDTGMTTYEFEELIVRKQAGLSVIPTSVGDATVNVVIAKALQGDGSGTLHTTPGASSCERWCRWCRSAGQKVSRWMPL